MNILERSKQRYSVRKYTTQAVEKEKIEYLLECARWAPSAVNFQPWKLIVVESETSKANLQQCYDRDWFKQAPVYIVVCANLEQSWKRKCDNKDHAYIDVAIAVEHIVMAVSEVGLGTCWECNFDPSLCTTLLNLPEGIEPVALLPIGYPNDSIGEKKRKSMSEIVEWK